MYCIITASSKQLDLISSLFKRIENVNILCTEIWSQYKSQNFENKYEILFTIQGKKQEICFCMVILCEIHFNKNCEKV